MDIGLTTATGDYLKALYDLGLDGSWVSSSLLAQRLGVSAPSATAMVQRLADQLLRHHRLIELYLERALGYPWDRVHEEAEKLEHTISEELEDRIDAALGHPTEDPHGHPIPPKEGEYREEPIESLWAAEGDHLLVRRVSDRDPQVLRYLDEIGLRPGAAVRVVRRAPFEGPVTIEVEGDGAEHAVGERLARQVFVVPAAARAGGRS